MGPRHSWIRFVGIALVSALGFAWAQPATPPPPVSEAFVVVTSAEEVLGTWVSQIGAVAIRFDEDGTLRSARSTDTLESAPYAINSYRFEDEVMLVTELEVSGVPSCGEAVGRYKAWRLEGGNLHIVAIDDLCDGRAADMTREYVPTDSAGYVVVTSAEEVLGTWHVRTHYLRFDEDGTFRQAVGQSALEIAPYAIDDYRFEGGEMLVTSIAFMGVPTTGNAVGRYEVRLLAGGDLQIVLLEDPEGGRSGNLEWVYAPVVSEGDVIVTSAEKILGTWRHLAARTRFDEDGTFRSAWSSDTLESAPYAVCSYHFEGGEMLVAELAVSGVPTCGDAVGRYRAWRLESGELQIVAIDDPCPGRSDDMTRVYGRAE